jgi:hypothetical protein
VFVIISLQIAKGLKAMSAMIIDQKVWHQWLKDNTLSKVKALMVAFKQLISLSFHSGFYLSFNAVSL